MEFLGIRTKSGAIVQPNSGEEMIRKFDFAYSTPNLTTGVVVYQPTVGDILLDVWFQITTAFNGTTPKLDVGQFIGGNDGWFGGVSFGPVDATVADHFQLDSGGVLSSGAHIVKHADGTVTPATPPSVSLAQTTSVVASTSAGAFSSIALERNIPGMIVSAAPVELVLTQTGQKGGAATGATQGAGTVYFLTGTPQ